MASQPQTMQHERSRRRTLRAAEHQRNQMISLALMGVGLILLAGLVYTLLRPAANAGLRPAAMNQPFGEMSLNDLSGKPVNLSDYAGRPVLINVWATWCPPCRAEMPLLQDYYTNHQADGYVMLALNAGEPLATVQQFIQVNGFDFPVLLDPGEVTLDRLGIYSYPTSILVDRQGVVRVIHVGMFTSETLESEVTPRLGQ